MSDKLVKVLVRDSDMLSAKSLLTLLGNSIEGMKNKMSTDKTLTDNNKVAIAGAVEALTDLHNLVLQQLQDARAAEEFETDGGDDHGGKFDA